MVMQVSDSSMIDTWADNGLIIKPPTENFETGWRHGQQPPREWMNWLQNTFGQKINHVLRHGMPEWHTDNQYQTDDFTKRAGLIFKAVAPSQGEDPLTDTENDFWVEFAGGGQAFRGCLIYKTTNQTVNVDTQVPVTFDAEDYDTDNFHDNVTNNTRITIPAGVSKARFVGQISWSNASGADGWRTIWLVKNGLNNNDPPGHFRGVHAVAFPSGFLIQQCSSAVIQVVENDFFELWGFQTTDDPSADISGDASDPRTWFSMEIIE